MPIDGVTFLFPIAFLAKSPILFCFAWKPVHSMNPDRSSMLETTSSFISSNTPGLPDGKPASGK